VYVGMWEGGREGDRGVGRGSVAKKCKRRGSVAKKCKRDRVSFATKE